MSNLTDKDEIFTTKQVDPEKIKCKTCVHRNGGGMKYPHYTKGSCEMYPLPQTKPSSILFENGDCDFYVEE